MDENPCLLHAPSGYKTELSVSENTDVHKQDSKLQVCSLLVWGI